MILLYFEIALSFSRIINSRDTQIFRDLKTKQARRIYLDTHANLCVKTFLVPCLQLRISERDTCYLN